MKIEKLDEPPEVDKAIEFIKKKSKASEAVSVSDILKAVFKTDMTKDRQLYWRIQRGLQSKKIAYKTKHGTNYFYMKV